jgi:ABC-type nitrate/sulfonate/bicarbonate transport system permease component
MRAMHRLRHLAGLGLFLGIWQASLWAGWVEPFLLPSPLQVAQALADMAREGSLWIHMAASLQRVLVGFALACAVGLGLGFLTGAVRPLADLFKPLIEALRPIPPLAWIPLAIVWFGIGNAPSYFLVFIGAVFPGPGCCFATSSCRPP